MLPNILPIEASHTSLDIFERSPVLITFDSSFEQKVGPTYSPDGPTLEFEIVGDRNNFLDLQKIFLEIKCKILQNDNNNLRYDNTSTANSDLPIFVNNTLHSLFSECTITANGIKISNSNGVYAHKAFIETEFSNSQEAKKTWLKCQGYTYEEAPQTVTSTVFTERQAETRSSAEVTYFGKVAADIFSCDKHLLSGVSLRISFVRSRPEFVLIHDDVTKNYKIKILQASLYVRKMTVSDQVFTAIEKTLTKTPALYHYTEVLPKTYLIPSGNRSWMKEDIFSKEPIRRFALALCTNAAFLGSKMSNPFHYQKFNLNEVTVYRNGFPVAGTPLSTENEKRIYISSMDALAFGYHSHGIPFQDYTNHFVMVFDLTSTQQASHDYLYPELTNAAVSLELKFANNLASSVEVFLLGEKASTIYINSNRKVSKNVILTA